MKAVKVLGYVIAGIAVLAALAITLASLLFDPNDYKGQVAAAVEQRTGRTLTLEGDLKLAYFPWLAVETGAMQLGNAPGFGTAPFASVERAALRVKLAPLLKRRVEVGTVELDGLVLNLARDAQGATNWDDLRARLEAARAEAAPPPGPAADAAAARTLELAGLRVSGGTVRWYDDDTLRFSVANLAASIGSIVPGAPVHGTIEATFEDLQSGLTLAGTLEATAVLAADGGVELRDLTSDLTVARGGGAARDVEVRAATVRYDAAAATLTAAAVRASSGATAVEGEVSVTSLRENPSVRAQLELDAASVAELLALADRPVPAALRAADVGPIAARAAVELESAPHVVRIEGFEAAVLGATVRGDAEIRDRRTLTGRIEIPEHAATDAARAFLANALPAASVDVSALQRLGLTTRLEADLETRRTALRELDLRALGARIQGELDVAPSERGTVLRGSIATSRFSSAPLVQAFRARLPEPIDAAKIGDVQARATFVLDTASGTLALAPFAAELFGLSGSGEVRGVKLGPAAQWSGRIEVAEFAPQALIARFGLPPQPTSDPAAFTRARLATRFDVTAERGRFEDIELALDDSRITGSFTVDGFRDPLYGFALAVDRVDADRYLPPPRDAAARAAEDGPRTAGDIELPANNTMRLDGTMTVGALALAGIQFADVGARIVIGDGNLAIENARANLYGGRFDGAFRVRAAGNEPGLQLTGKASDLELAAMIQALTKKPANLSGTGSFDLDLSGSGRRIIDNVATASGNVGFALRSGAIQGFNLGRTICAAWNIKERAPAPPDQPQETRFEVIQGTAAVAGGVATSRDLLARTSFMDVTGSGTLGLASQELDYVVEAKLTRAIGMPNCATTEEMVGQSIPLEIEGVVSEPDIDVDFSKIIRRVLQEEIKERLIDRALRGILN